jgi:hypothetical protein
MKTRISPHWSRTATLVAAAALTAGLVPAVTSSADAAPGAFPSFGFLTYAGPATHSATTDKLWATTPGSFTSTTALTPNTYAYAYDVSTDGQTLAVTGQSRALTVPGLNTTYGLLLVQKGSPDVTTNVATIVESNPVLSPDGGTLWWYDSGAIWKYDVASKVTTKASTRFVRKSTERVGRIAISDDGTAGAVVFTTSTAAGTLTSSRIQVGRLDGTGTGYQYIATVASGFSYPVGSTLVFTSSTTVAFNVWVKGALTDTWSVTLTAGAPTLTKDTGLDAQYDLGTDGTSWYAFQDVTSPTTGTQVAKSGTPFTPGTFESFPLGTGTTRYVPATATPPVAAADATAVVNRATATSYLFLARSTVPTGTKVMYASLAAYLTDPTGTRSADTKAQTRFGILKTSTDRGATFRTSTPTGAASRLLTWPTGAPFGNGYTAALSRNTWLQWCFQGDAYVANDCSVTKKITVNPKVTTVVQKLGATKRVYGRASRVGGTAVLSRFVGGKWVGITTAKIGSTGTFSFGFRKMVPGSYKVATKADTYWGSGLKQFTI